MDMKSSKCGVYKHLNNYPEVVKNPTRYNGGMNAPVTAVKNPTKYTGGKNPNLVTVKKSY
jgi:hypothetical protein